MFLKKVNNALAGVAIFLITIYRKIISPFTHDSCIYYPSCSTYSLEAFKKYGLIKGLLKSSWRILRCNPWNKGGYDPLK